MRAAERTPLLLIPVAAAIAIIPLLLRGPSYGHDFDFHLLNWMEVARQFGQGTFHLHWAYTPAYNAGEPRFVFYPPLSWTLGAALGLMLTHIPGITPESAWAASPLAFIWICLTASGLCMYRAARAFGSRNAALIASVLYLANPYMLFTAYERAAYAELLAAAWMPLLLLALLAPRIRATHVALPVALLWLTNAPAAVIGCYTVVALAAFRVMLALRNKPTPAVSYRPWWRDVANVTAGLMLGAGAAGFYLIPAAVERRFVQVGMAAIGGLRIDSNFLFEHTGASLDAVAHDAVLRTASRIAVILLIASTLCLLASRTTEAPAGRLRIPSGQRPLPATLLFCMLGLTAFLLIPWSNLMWQHVPELKFLQFPWRFLLVVTPIGAIAASSSLSRFRLDLSIAFGISLAVAMVLTISAYLPFHQTPTRPSPRACMHSTSIRARSPLTNTRLNGRITMRSRLAILPIGLAVRPPHGLRSTLSPASRRLTSPSLRTVPSSSYLTSATIPHGTCS
jgi:hypothetical protein